MTGIAAISPSSHPALSPGPSDAAAQSRAVTRLTLTNFRNYAHARIEPNAQSVVLTGENGAGKTNVLEAISFLAPGRGLRRAKLSEVTRCDTHDADVDSSRCWAVAAKLGQGDDCVDLGTGLDPDATSIRDRRVVRVDGETERSQAVLSEHVAVVWLTPQMDGLFIEGPGGRRRFLDRLVYAADPAHAGRVSAYEQAMRERSRLLSDRGTGADAGWLDALEGTMAEKGMAVAAARRDMVGRLVAFIDEDTGPFPTADLALVGGPEAWLDDGPALAAEEKFRAQLSADRHQDAADGRTHSGPHRTDLDVRHRAKAREAGSCSTGEQKALLIGLVLAHARMQAVEQGRCPILLLDEVAAHLDQERRLALFDLIDGLGTQAWLTGTDPVLFDGMRGRAGFFDVTNGAIHQTQI